MRELVPEPNGLKLAFIKRGVPKNPLSYPLEGIALPLGLPDCVELGEKCEHVLMVSGNRKTGLAVPASVERPKGRAQSPCRTVGRYYKSGFSPNVRDEHL